MKSKKVKKSSEIKFNEFGCETRLPFNAENVQARCDILKSGIDAGEWEGNKLKRAKRLLKKCQQRLARIKAKSVDNKPETKRETVVVNAPTAEIKTKMHYQMAFGRIALILRDIATLEHTKSLTLDGRVQQDLTQLQHAYRAEIRVLEGAISRWEKATGNEAFKVIPIAEATAKGKKRANS